PALGTEPFSPRAPASEGKRIIRKDLSGRLLPEGAIARLETPVEPAPSGEGRILATAFSTDGRMVAGTSRNGTVTLWETATGKCLQRFQEQQASDRIAFSADGTWLAYGAEEAGLVL